MNDGLCAILSRASELQVVQLQVLGPIIRHL